MALFSRNIPAKIIVCVILLSLTGNIKADAIGHDLISEKSYAGKGTKDKESYTENLSIPDDKKSAPVWLTLYNGYGQKPGFSWVKATISASDADKDIGKSEIIADQHTFLKTHAKTVDLTGYFAAGPRKLSIECSGEKGAYFGWALTTAPSVLSLFNATTVTPGKDFMVHGVGFGDDKEKITVLINGEPCKITALKSTLLVATAPEKLEGDSVTLRVKVVDKLSNMLGILTNYVPPHLVSITPQGGNTGSNLTVRGSNFSRVAEENIVQIGPYTATVLKAVDSETLVCQIPDLGINNDTLALTVTTNGLKSDNYLNFWCGSEFF